MNKIMKQYRLVWEWRIGVGYRHTVTLLAMMIALSTTTIRAEYVTLWAKAEGSAITTLGEGNGDDERGPSPGKCPECQVWSDYMEECIPLPEYTAIDGEPCKECDDKGSARNKTDGTPCSPRGGYIGRCCNGECLDLAGPPECPPVCKPGEGIANTKIYVNGNEIGGVPTGPPGGICDGMPLTVTGTGEDKDEQWFYEWLFSACDCKYTHHTIIPGTVTMEIDSIGPLAEFNCSYSRHIKVLFKSECDDPDVEQAANVIVLKCDETYNCCIDKSLDWDNGLDIALAQRKCRQFRDACKNRCP